MPTNTISVGAMLESSSEGSIAIETEVAADSAPAPASAGRSGAWAAAEYTATSSATSCQIASGGSSTV